MIWTSKSYPQFCCQNDKGRRAWCRHDKKKTISHRDPKIYTVYSAYRAELEERTIAEPNIGLLVRACAPKIIQ